MTIPEPAVEAAAKALCSAASLTKWEDHGPLTHEVYRIHARAALEAAEQHMFAPLLDIHQEDLFRGHLSNGCKTCAGGEWPCETAVLVKRMCEGTAL